MGQLQFAVREVSGESGAGKGAGGGVLEIEGERSGLAE